MGNLVCVTLAFAIAAFSLAQSATEKPREQIWKHKWVRSAINQLEKEGLWCNGDVLVESRPPSNYEIAVGVLESVRLIKESMKKAQETVDSLEAQRLSQISINDPNLPLPATLKKLSSFSNQVSNVEKMATLLRHEISNLGIDAESFISDIPTLRLELEKVYSRGVMTAARTYRIPESPKLGYVSRTIHGLMGDGLASSYNGLLAGSDARDYKAQQLIACCDDLTKFSKMAKSLIVNLKSKLQTKPSPSEMDQINLDLNDASLIVDLLAKWSTRRRDIDRTIAFFSMEITALGRDPNELKRQLKEAL